jgi:imidazole glycerol phosphate synthase subunit HisF
MIENLNDYLVSIAIGIRFRANFAIEDKLGSIVQLILHTRNSLFNPEIFPVVLSDGGEKRLMNEKTGDYLRVNNSNIVLEMNLEEQTKLDDIPEINKRFNQDIVNGIMKEFNITQINRVGYIKKYLFKIEELSKVFIKKTIGGTLEGVNDINLRFSKKFPIEEALARKGVNDYHNVIYNIIKIAGKDEIFMSVDYQRYYDPFLDSVSGLKFLGFVDKMERYNSKNYLEWLNKYYGK